MVKMMIVGRRRGGMSVAQLHRYMREVHGAAVVRFIAEQPTLTPQRYVQNHVFDASFRVPGDAADPFTVARDFVTQVWFDSPAQAAAAMQAPFYLEHLRPDEDRFVDQASVVKLPVIEELRHGSAGNGGPGKLFVFHRRAEAVSPDDLATATAALWAPLIADTTSGIQRWVRNRPLQRPGESLAADLVDELWLGDDDATRRLGEHWLALAETGPLAALTAPGSSVVLFAREHVLHAGRT